MFFIKVLKLSVCQVDNVKRRQRQTFLLKLKWGVCLVGNVIHVEEDEEEVYNEVNAS